MKLQKKRRIIYNDDGDAARVVSCGKKTVKDFLASRFNWCVDSQVDSYFWCVGNGAEVPWNEPYQPELGDVHQLMIDEARKASMEIFASLRMNDIHDAFMHERLPKIKIEHPEYLIGKKEDFVPDERSMVHFFWSAFDYSHKEVRKYFLDYIKDMCSRYDWDGLEIDFCRHALYFKFDETEKHYSAMTDFVEKVRQCIEGIAKQRGRDFLLAVRVPDTVQLCLRVGLDIQDWLSKGLVDILIAGGGDKPYSTPYSELIDLGHRFKVPVYPSINVGIAAPINTEDKEGHVAERMRGIAGNLWSQNPDGIYLFNLFVPVDTAKDLKVEECYSVLKEIGELKKLQYLDKIYEAEAPRKQPCIQYVSMPYIFSVSLINCPHIPLKIADAVESSMVKKKLKELKLRIRITDIGEGQSVRVLINGQPVQITGSYAAKAQGKNPYREIGGRWFEADIEAPLLRYGVNDIEIRPATGCWPKTSTMIQQVQLWIKYCHHE